MEEGVSEGKSVSEGRRVVSEGRRVVSELGEEMGVCSTFLSLDTQ